MKKFILLLAMFFVAIPARSQDTLRLSLDSCCSRALRSQSKVKNAELSADQARCQKTAALSKYFPTLSAGAVGFHSADYLVDLSSQNLSESGIHVQVNGNSLGDDIENLLRMIDVDASLQMLDKGAGVSLTAIQPIFTGGRIVNGNRLAALGQEAALLQLDMARDEVRQEVAENYWMLASLREKLLVTDRLLGALDTLLGDVQTANGAGVAGTGDVLKVRLKRSELLSARLRLENGIRLASMALGEKIGLWTPDSLVVPADPLVAPPLLASPADEGLWDVSHRNECRLLDCGVEAEHLKHKMAVGERLPQLMAGAIYGYSDILNNSFSGNGLLFASLTIPLSGWWEGAADIRRQALEQQKAENTRTESVRMLQLQTEQAHQQLAEAYRLLQLRQEALDAAAQNLEEAGHYYDAGMMGIDEYLQAQSMLQTCQMDLIDSEAACLIARSRWTAVAPRQE